jgi:crotonobetainyl-CoA:carnitine CoA-transferase CaiB-like acyl-CoA transferase
MARTSLPLDGVRVLDLANETGFLCGKMLADLGADVIKVERPGGDPSRSIGPYYQNVADPNKSLHWFAHNLNKRSITLDIEGDEGKGLLKDLAAQARFFIETFEPGYLDGLGLGYAALGALNPGLVMVSITPFGQAGPYSGYASSDLIQMAMGGFTYMDGDPDRAPLRISFDQSPLLAGSQAAAAAMIALYHRQTSGEGQHVDVSIQASVASSISSAVPYWLTTGQNRHRLGGVLEGIRAVRQRSIWPCKDGHLVWALFGGRRGEREQGPLVQWMDEAGMADDFIKGYEWGNYDIYKSTQDLHDKLEGYFARFFITQTKAELLEKGVRRGMMTYPVSSPKNVAENPQLKAREIWAKVDHPELGRALTYPASWFKSTEFEADVRRRAPLIGEHTDEVLSELARQSGKGADPGRPVVPKGGAAQVTERALETIKVADFCQLTAGHLTTKMLADHGATVVVVETLRSALGRASGPFKDGIAGPDRATQHAYNNANKYSVSIDLGTPEGIEVAKRLVAWADVVVENFRPGVMEKWGLGYEDLVKIQPDVVMLRLSSQGQTGPFRGSRSYGLHLHALFGIANFVGWPDRDPTGLMFAYPDFFVPFFANTVLLGALKSRRVTGKGQLIDLSQAEVCAQFLAPYLLEYEANAEESGRAGNRHPSAAPHGVYPCKGDDRWCAIAVFTDQQWEAFRSVIDDPPWSGESRFETFADRKQHEDELDALIGDWTAKRSPETVMELMQDAGVAAGVVKSGKDVAEDPQLRERGFLWTLPHNEIGDFAHLGQPSIMSKTPAQGVMPAPCIGQHTEYVLTNLLDMPDDEFVELTQKGVFS